MADNTLRRLRDQAAGPATLINEGCKIAGVLSGTGNYQISGEIEGECDLKGTVSISRSGYWKGTIRAGSVIVAGTVDGDIAASGNVEISDTAKISGTVTGEAIAVAEGAVVEGVMKTTGRSQPQEFTEKRNAAGDD